MTKYESVFNYKPKYPIQARAHLSKNSDHSMGSSLEQTISRQSPDDINFLTPPSSFSKQLINQLYFYLSLSSPELVPRFWCSDGLSVNKIHTIE